MKGAWFNSLNTHCSSQLSVIPLPGDLNPSHGNTCRQNTYVHKNKKKHKKENKHLEYLGQEWTGKQDTCIMLRGEHTLTIQTREKNMAAKMAQQGRERTTKPDDRSSIPRNHMEGEKQLLHTCMKNNHWPCALSHFPFY